MTTPDDAVERLLRSKKYRRIGLHDATVRAVLADEYARHRDPRRAVEAARRKLHHIAAAYLGDPDYDAAEREVRDAAASGDRERLLQVCRRVASTHATTRERLEVIDEYYGRVFAVTGVPHAVLDLACGLNPVLLPWMNLPPDARYHAYDIRIRRVEFLQRFLQATGRPPLAELRDVLLSPPDVAADLALLLQEAHRIEQRRAGATRGLLEALPVRHVVVSLPLRGLSGRTDLARAHTALFERIVKDAPWSVQPLAIGGELVFCIDKRPR